MGAPTQTQALLSASPATDAGNPSGCKDGHGHLLTTDQRGQPRADKAEKETSRFRTLPAVIWLSRNRCDNEFSGDAVADARSPIFMSSPWGLRCQATNEGCPVA